MRPFHQTIANNSANNLFNAIKRKSHFVGKAVKTEKAILRRRTCTDRSVSLYFPLIPFTDFCFSSKHR